MDAHSISHHSSSGQINCHLLFPISRPRIHNCVSHYELPHETRMGSLANALSWPGQYVELSSWCHHVAGMSDDALKSLNERYHVYVAHLPGKGLLTVWSP